MGEQDPSRQSPQSRPSSLPSSSSPSFANAQQPPLQSPGDPSLKGVSVTAAYAQMAQAPQVGQAKSAQNSSFSPGQQGMEQNRPKEPAPLHAQAGHDQGLFHFLHRRRQDALSSVPSYDDLDDLSDGEYVAAETAHPAYSGHIEEPPRRLRQSARAAYEASLASSSYDDIDDDSYVQRAELSFFEALQKAIISGDIDVVKKELLERSPLEELREFHKTKAGRAFLSQKETERRLLFLLGELRTLERAWIAAKQDTERAERKLLSIETDLSLRLEEIKPLLKDSLPVMEQKAKEEVAKTPEANDEGHARENPGDWFYVCDGRVWKSIRQFRDEIPFISESTFSSHVKPDRNDFATWINAIFDRSDLATLVASCFTKEALLNALK